MGTIFNTFIEFIAKLFLLYILFFFGLWGMWDPSSLTTLPALEGQVLTTGPLGKSLLLWFSC